MSLQEQNRLLQILHKNGVNRENVKIIIDDLRKSGIFDEYEIDNDFGWEVIDRKADIWFSDLTQSEKLAAIHNINVNHETRSDSLRTYNSLNVEKRILRKIKEMEERGLVDPGDEKEIKPRIAVRYGRTPLHEAIAMRNLPLVKKYVKRGLYLTCLDNNGHTPMQMAYYEGYKEAMMIFKTYQTKK